MITLMVYADASPIYKKDGKGRGLHDNNLVHYFPLVIKNEKQLICVKSVQNWCMEK